MTEVTQERCLPLSKISKINTDFKLYQGDFFEEIKRVSSPVDCIIVRPSIRTENDIGFIVEVLSWCPLRPEGSVWVFIRDSRSADGMLVSLSEKFIAKMSGFVLADKACLFANLNQTESRCRKHLPLLDLCLRFTKLSPLEAWFDPNAVKSSVWSKSPEENKDWYINQILSSCPEDGIVLDVNCINGYVGTAALSVKRHFIGISTDISNAKEMIYDKSE